MPKDLTRKALYELVWTTPRTELAKRFSISDVALGKVCRQMNVPAPPPGYWAHVAAKGRKKAKFIQPPLTYTLAERIDEDHAEIRKSSPTFDPEKLDDPLPSPPSIAETPDDAVERYVQLARAVPLPKPSRGMHPVVAKLLREDERLAALATTYSWERPKYMSPHGKQLLAGLNRLLWWWSDLGFEPSSSGTRHIRLYVYRQSFEISANPAHQDVAAKAKSSAPLFELRFDIDSRYVRQKEKPALKFSAFDTEMFVSTARLLIQRRETGFRDWLKRIHEHRIWERDEALKKDRAAKEAARQRNEAERKALLASRERAIDDAISGMTKADHLRSLANEVEQRIQPDGVHSPAFARWKKWMLEKADALDIRTKTADTLAEWVANFHISAEDHT